jgi:predicted esterase YcpF (UPF0227 family)
MKIIYIHGYGSSGSSESASKLKNFIPELITPTYDPSTPSKSLKELLELVDSQRDEVLLIGSSLGGWYANQICNRRKKAIAVLYNPSTQPEKTLSKYGISKEILEEYKKLKVANRDSAVYGPMKTVILSTDDEVIDYQIAKKYFRDKAEIVENTGGHRIGNNYPEVLREVAKLIKKAI